MTDVEPLPDPHSSPWNPGNKTGELHIHLGLACFSFFLITLWLGLIHMATPTCKKLRKCTIYWLKWSHVLLVGFFYWKNTGENGCRGNLNLEHLDHSWLLSSWNASVQFGFMTQYALAFQYGYHWGTCSQSPGCFKYQDTVKKDSLLQVLFKRLSQL